MRPVNLGVIDTDAGKEEALRELEHASHDDAFRIFDKIAVSNLAANEKSYSLDVDAATLDELRKLVGTLIQDIKERNA